MKQFKIGVLGSGSWATAIVKILQTNKYNINWWIREPEIAECIRDTGVNKTYLSSVHLNPKMLYVDSDIKSIIEKSDIIVLAIPSIFIDSAFSELICKDLKNKKIISAVKGIVPEKMMIVAKYLETRFKIPNKNLGIITGPSHAEEIALEKLTFLTAASRSKAFRETIMEVFSCRYVRTIPSNDIYGLEYATVLKNIYALGGGILKGLGYGDNFFAAYIANCTKEMKIFIRHLHPVERTHYHSAYLGDLLVTSYSQFSRNRTFGQMIGQGYSVASAKLEMKMVAEGYFATNCIHVINEEYKADIPIIDAIYNVLFLNRPPAIEMKKIIEVIR
jgi:glycerol-3-phosphate dehydrogenase (NAD(P)+)